MVNYQLGKIYKVISPHTELFYIGSTTKRLLSQRMGKHRGDFNSYKAGKTNYISSFEYGDAKIELIEIFPCNSKDELIAREGVLIRENKDLCVNKNVAGRSIQESSKACYEKNKVKRLADCKKYVADNIDKVRAYRNTIIDCECGEKTTNAHKYRHMKSKKHINL